MLSDRPYMREPQYQPSPLKPLYWLIGIIVGVFILQLLIPKWFGGGAYRTTAILFSLSEMGVGNGYIWSFISYSFLHTTQGSFWLLHVLLNCLMIFWIGRVMLPLLGPQRFFTLYGLAVFLGGLVWFTVNYWTKTPGLLIGASAGVMGIFVAFAMHMPNQPMRVLIFLIIPVDTTPWTLLKVLLIFDSVGLLINELELFGSMIMPIAHSAHLGGMFGGWVFVKFILNKDFTIATPDIKPPRWFVSDKTKKAKIGKFKINFTNRKELQKEVDRILDKINKEGFGALSEEEHSTLDKAKELLNR